MGAASADRSLISCPSNWTVPVDTAVKPVIASMNVVLPAPFGPISPTSLPGSTREVDAVVGGQAAIADGQVAGLEERHVSTASATGDGRGPLAPVDTGCGALATAGSWMICRTIERMNSARNAPSSGIQNLL